MAGAGDVGLAAFFDGLERADLVAPDVVRPAARSDELPEFVVEALVSEVTLLLGHPFLQAKMRLDDEFGHPVLPVFLPTRAVYSHSADTPWHFPDGEHSEAVTASTKKIEADLPIFKPM